MKRKLRQTLGDLKGIDDEWSAYATAATIKSNTNSQTWRIDPLVQRPSTRSQLKTYKKKAATNLVGLETFNFEARVNGTYSSSFSQVLGNTVRETATNNRITGPKFVKITKTGHSRSRSVGLI